VEGRPLNRGRALACLALALAGLLGSAGPARALITPPVTLDGPSSAISGFGGVAMASDGSGGLVYVKTVEGAPHVFACRLLHGSWSAPIRVDAEMPYEASQPAIAAGPGGELLVVWVTQVATLKSGIRYGLYSAQLSAGSGVFAPALPVDANVGEGKGVNPSLAATAPSKAIVAYRVVTDSRLGESESPIVALRPGDVAADIRVARFNGERWSNLGAVNRSSESSMRPPSATNGPQVGAGATGQAVVAWQEPDQTGTARIWMRRIFGSTPGQVLEASPTSWEGHPVSADADAFSLSVTPYAMARVVFRIARTAGSALAGRLLVNTLPSNFSPTAGVLAGAELADGKGFAGTVGPPDVALAEDGSRNTTTRLAFLAGTRLRQMTGTGEGGLSPVAIPGEPRASAGGEAVVAANPAGGGLIAYPALDSSGLAAVAVRQEYPSGAVQTGLLSGARSGPVSGLAIGRSGSGDGLIGFLQGEPGRREIVAERVTAPPAAFSLKVPKGWVRPRQAKLEWGAAQSAVGGVRYTVLLEGRAVRRGLRRLRYRPRPGQLGNGALRTRILATDALGQQILTAPKPLKVDGQAPLVRVRAHGAAVAIKVRDGGSGLAPKATRVGFGDGSAAAAGAGFRHRYQQPGRYELTVKARDEVGNRVLRRFRVRVR
jgi:PKD domain